MATQYQYTRIPGTDLQPFITMLETALAAHGAWTLVDTVNSGASMPCRVWKMAKATSPSGMDWYLAIARTANNPSAIYIAMAEGYDVDKKALIRPAPGNNSQNVVPSSDFSYGGGTAYPLWNGNNPNFADIYWHYVQINGSYPGHDFSVVVNDAGIYMWSYPYSNPSQGSISQGMYAGWIETFDDSLGKVFTIGDPFSPAGPTVAPSQGVTTTMRTTRHATVPATGTYNWTFMPAATVACAWTPQIGVAGSVGDRFWNGRPVAGRRCFRSNGNNIAVWGDLLGLWPSLLSIAVANAGTTSTSVQNGDTTQIPRPGSPAINDTWVYAYRVGAGQNSALWVNTTAPY